MALGSLVGKDDALAACYGDDHSSVWPDDVYFHLWLSDPTMGGTELATGVGDYAPVEVANNSTNFPDPSGGQLVNGTTVSFPQSTGPWSGIATFAGFTDDLVVAPPMSPSVAPEGTSGTTTWSYQVTATNAVGETTASGSGTTFTGNASLTGSNYNKVSWNSVSGATGYNVYRLVAGVWLLIGSTSSLFFDDIGGSPSAVSPPLVNTTSNVLDYGPLAQSINVTMAGVVVSFPPGSISVTS